MIKNRAVVYMLEVAIVCLACCSMLICLPLPVLARDDNLKGRQAYQERKALREKEYKERMEKDRKERERRERKAKEPSVAWGDVVDVKVEKLLGGVRISIVTTSPLFFEAGEGKNGDGMNYLTVELPNVRLAWSDGEQKTIEVDHGGVKNITLTQFYEPDFKVEARLKLLPQASYNVYPAMDTKAVVMEVRESAPEGQKEAVKEEPAEKEPVEESPPVLVTIDVVDAEIQQVLRTVSEQSKLNIVTHSKVKGEITAKLKDVPVETALNVILGVNGLAYKKIDNTIMVGPEEQIAKQITTSQVIKLKHIDAESARDALAGVIPEHSIQINKETNNIIITSVPDKLKEARKVIDEVDKSVPQVELNAKVIEVGLDASRELGIDWSKGIGVAFREKEISPVFAAETAATGTSFLQLHQFARTAFEAKLKALISQGHARLLSNPRIVTMKDKEARIFIGDRIPYTVTTVTGGVALTEVRFVEPGIKLNITPKIVNDDFVVIDIAPEVSYIYSFRGPQDEFPWVRTREAKASIRIKDGETLILGGLLSKEDKKTISRVPVLSAIPILGEAFKNTKQIDNDTELLIVVTPTILKR